jgi:hypothetical protein
MMYGLPLTRGRAITIDFCDFPNLKYQRHRDLEPVRLHSPVRFHSDLELFSREKHAIDENFCVIF